MLNSGVPELMYWLTPVGALFGAGGGAWLFLKATLNGTIKRVEDIEKSGERVEQAVHKVDVRLSVLQREHEFLAKSFDEHPIKCPWQPRGGSERTRSSDPL